MELDGAVFAVEGAAACPLLVLCCSVVGNGFGDRPAGGGTRCTCDLSITSSPVKPESYHLKLACKAEMM